VSAVAGSSGAMLRDRDDGLMRLLLIACGLFMLIALLLPVAMILTRSLQDADGAFVGLANYRRYFGTGAPWQSMRNSLFVSGATTAIVVTLAFAYAYALTRTRMRWRGFFRVMAMVPLLSPSLLKAIGLVYWFGNQGLLKSVLMGESVYGPIGIILSCVLWTFPHAVIILMTALALADARVYEAATALRTSAARTFWRITLPSVRYGLIGAAIVVFVNVFTDFGAAKVIGGSYSVLATDIYKEVVGQQNFSMGAVVSVVLLLPALLAFLLERFVARKQAAALGSRAVPLVPAARPLIDGALFGYCLLVTLFILAILGMAQFAALVKFWPYNLSLGFGHYVFNVQGVGWDNFGNSLTLAFWVASVGTPLVFLGAYVVEKPRADGLGRGFLHAAALLPMAVPGLVLGLGTLLFINQPGNPLGLLYGSMSILVINTLAHLYTVPHLTAVTALKQVDREFEAVGASLKVPMLALLRRVTIPVCMPAILDIWIYLFLNAMTTLSAVIFLYSADTKLASVAAIHLDEAGSTASAAAMATLMVYASLAVRLLHLGVSRFALRRVQAWRGGG
jgi:iron(III) transport system permease protein